MSGGGRATESWRRILWIGLAVLAIGAAIGVWSWMKTREEERTLYSALEPYFTSEANRAWEDLPRSARVETGRRALSAVERLEGTPWGISITDLRALDENDEEDAREAVFRLEAGDTELLDCVVPSPAASSAEHPAGSCFRFRHTVPSSEPRLQNVPLALHLGDRPYAESLESGRLLLLPSPRDPEQLDRIPVAAFSPRSEVALRSIEHYKLDVSYDMPAPLSPFFDGADRLRIFYAEAATSVDLTATSPVFRFEGMLEVLNVPRGRAVLEYQPGHYAAAAVTDVSLPIALSNVCLNIDQALVEVDFVEKRLRVAGSTRNGTADHFACRHAGAGVPMDFTTRLGLGAALAAARAVFDLPHEWTSQGQAVLDLKDGIVCGDLAVQGSSLFHAAYFGNESTFRMWAPWSFRKNDIRPGRPVGSLLDLGLGALLAPRSFPPTNPRQCWEGDDGPKIDLESTILAGWQQDQEDYLSVSPVVPAAAF